jgi:CBS domain-containing protein
MKVREIMTKQVASCHPEATLESVALMMWNSDCGSIPVVDEQGTPKGIVTDRDVAMASALQHKPLWEITAAQFADGRDLFTCTTEDDVRAALQAMEDHRIRRLPVVDSEGHLQGMLSVDDIVALAESTRGGKPSSELSAEDAMDVLKAVCKHH